MVVQVAVGLGVRERGGLGCEAKSYDETEYFQVDTKHLKLEKIFSLKQTQPKSFLFGDSASALFYLYSLYICYLLMCKWYLCACIYGIANKNLEEMKSSTQN